MSAYPSDQRCPRCQYPVSPGAATCANCGLALSGSPGAGSNPAYPLPPQQPGSGNSYGTLPSADPYGSPASPGNQQPTFYGGNPGTINSAPTMQSPLYPQSPGGWGSGQQPPPAYPPPPPGYTSTQAQFGIGSAPAYPGSQPQGSFGAPPAYPGSQPQGGFGAPPAYPGSQPQGGFGAPPIAAPSAPQMQPTQKKGNGLKIVIIALVAVIILGGGGTAAYLLTRPKPTVSITSDYKVGSTPAGATDTSFRFSGQDFSGNSGITILLDGKSAPGTAGIQSDSNGNVNTDLKVTADWPTGPHTVTAKDASGYTTKVGAPIQIVAQGVAGTPGPNGAPTNSISFTLKISITSQAGTDQETLVITGNGDSGGSVCQTRDDGQTRLTEPGTLSFPDGNQFSYNEISTNQCSGTYVGGKLTYTETTVTDEFDFTGGLQCPISPHKKQVLNGTFTGPTTITGTFSEDSFTLETCQEKQGSGPIKVNGDTGTFTGTLNK